MQKWWREVDYKRLLPFYPKGPLARSKLFLTILSNLRSYPTLTPHSSKLLCKMVEGGGFEPPKAEPSDLQSDPFGHSGTPPNSKSQKEN